MYAVLPCSASRLPLADPCSPSLIIGNFLPHDPEPEQ
jgi:hypothetical protein